MFYHRNVPNNGDDGDGGDGAAGGDDGDEGGGAADGDGRDRGGGRDGGDADGGCEGISRSMLSMRRTSETQPGKSAES